MDQFNGEFDTTGESSAGHARKTVNHLVRGFLVLYPRPRLTAGRGFTRKWTQPPGMEFKGCNVRVYPYENDVGYLVYTPFRVTTL